MWLTLRASTSRSTSAVVQSTASRRCLATAVTAPSSPKAPPPVQPPPRVTRYEHALASKAFAPSQYAQTPETLLETIGRNAPKYLGEKATTWEGLTKAYREGTGPLKEAGVSVKDRKYYMACLTRYLRGEKPVDFVRKPRPAKVFRRWGGKVQKGVRIFDQQGKRVHRTG